jgi:hypothetical protein
VTLEFNLCADLGKLDLRLVIVKIARISVDAFQNDFGSFVLIMLNEPARRFGDGIDATC